DLHAGIAQFDRFLDLDFIFLRRHVVIPERDGTPVAHSLTQEIAHRHTGQLARGVEQGHLQARAQAVVPHEAEGRLADDARCILHASPGVIGEGFTPADNARVRLDADQFDFGPGVDARTLHFSAYSV